MLAYLSSYTYLIEAREKEWVKAVGIGPEKSPEVGSTTWMSERTFDVQTEGCW